MIITSTVVGVVQYNPLLWVMILFQKTKESINSVQSTVYLKYLSSCT